MNDSRVENRRELTVQEHSGYHISAVPSISLKGKWLQELGFEKGMKISVMCEKGCLVIKPAMDTESMYDDCAESDHAVDHVADSPGQYSKSNGKR